MNFAHWDNPLGFCRLPSPGRKAERIPRYEEMAIIKALVDCGCHSLQSSRFGAATSNSRSYNFYRIRRTASSNTNPC